MTTTKFKVGDHVRIVSNINRNTGWEKLIDCLGKISEVRSSEMYPYRIRLDTGEDSDTIWIDDELELASNKSNLTPKTMNSPLGRCYVPVPNQEKWNKLTEALEKHKVDFKWENCKNKPTDTGNGNNWENTNGEESAICFGYEGYGANEMARSRYGFFEEEGYKETTFEQAMKLLGNKATSTIIPAVKLDGTFYTEEDLIEKIAESEGVVKERKVLQKALKTFKPTKKRGRPVKAKRGRPPLKK